MRLIDADRLNEVLNINFGHTGGADVLRQLIDIQPTVQEPKTGHWILDETDNSITCDKCGCLIWANDISNGEAYYCPNCGARMESEEA